MVQKEEAHVEDDNIDDRNSIVDEEDEISSRISLAKTYLSPDSSHRQPSSESPKNISQDSDRYQSNTIYKLRSLQYHELKSSDATSDAKLLTEVDDIMSERKISDTSVVKLSSDEKDVRRGPELTRLCNRNDRVKSPEFIRMHIYENQRLIIL